MRILSVILCLFCKFLSIYSELLDCTNLKVESEPKFESLSSIFDFSSLETLKTGCPCGIQPCINLCCGDNILCEFEQVKHTQNGTIYFYGIPCDGDKLKGILIKYVRIRGGDLLVYYSKFRRQKSFKRARISGCKVDSNIRNCQSLVPDDKNLGFYKAPYSLVIISLLALIFLLTIYALDPKLRNIHGKLLMCHIVCVIISYIIYILRWEYAESRIKIPQELRQTLAIFLYYTDLSSIFWLNLMCFDIWTKLKEMSVSMYQEDGRTFLYYNFYGWGVPVIITVIGTSYISLVDGIETGLSDPILDIEPQIIYHTSIILLIISNLVFFCLTSFYIYKTKRQVTQHNNKRRDFNHVYIRLMIIMAPECRYLLLFVLFYGRILDSVTAAHIQSYFYAIHGLFTFVVYASSPNARRLFANLLNLRNYRKMAKASVELKKMNK